MFGFIQANASELTQEEKERYRAVYCGLCHALGNKYGISAQLSLNYDLTFLAMLLSSLYEPKEKTGKSRCVIHPCKQHVYVTNPYIEYAADMTIALTYFKCIDDWKDDHKLSQKCYASILTGAYQKVKRVWRGQCAVIEEELNIIADIERRKDKSPDAAANSFGRLMAGIFVMGTGYWSQYLQRIGYHVGKFIYLADAAVDISQDLKTGSYNPLVLLRKTPEDIRPILKVILGEAAVSFEALPLEQDVNIMRNILYSGIWIKYNQGVQKERKKTKHGH